MQGNNKNIIAGKQRSKSTSGDDLLNENLNLALKLSEPLQNSNDNQQADEKSCAQTSKPRIILDSKELSIANEAETILESIENAGIDLEFHCREGFCGVCRTKLLSGQVNYTLDPLAFIEDDEILICCSKPIGDIELKTLM